MSNESFVVAGGSSGIGLGIVKRLAEQGSDVVVLSRNSDQLGGIPGVDHVPVDFTKDEISADMLPDKINGLVYCPGSLNLKMFRGLTPDIFREDFEVNVVGAVKLIKAALGGMKAADSSSVLLFSTVAVALGMPAHASIAASKGAIEGLTRSLASEFGPNIRVNCVAPALTDTPLTERFFSNPEKAAAMGEKYPLKRTGTVEDFAEVADFLLSKKSSWITGQVIGVDGGMAGVK